MRRVLVMLLLAGTTTACAAPAAAAAPQRLVCEFGRTVADSNAPAGSSAAWLPPDEWVMERWLPFDSSRLTEIFEMSRPEIFTYLRGGNTTLESLAVERGLPLPGLAGRLLATRRGTVDARTFGILVSRTNRMLTQGHLAEHVLGHAFHNDTIWKRVPAVFGISDARYLRMNRLHSTPAAFGRAGGLDTNELKRRLLTTVQRSGQRGVALGAISPTENAEMQRINSISIDAFLNTPRP